VFGSSRVEGRNVMKPACFLVSVVALPLGWVACGSDRGTGVVETSRRSTAVATSEGCDSDRGTGVVETGFACPVTDAIWAEPPRDPNTDPFGMGLWYINADRTIWAGFDAVRMVACPDGNKVGWIRPQGAQLTVSGRRLDSHAPPAKASIPCCYPMKFQASALYFPTEGCWEILAKAGTSELTFVTRVGPARPPR
jgi:hypothetical protein